MKGKRESLNFLKIVHYEIYSGWVDETLGLQQNALGFDSHLPTLSGPKGLGRLVKKKKKVAFTRTDAKKSFCLSKNDFFSFLKPPKVLIKFTFVTNGEKNKDCIKKVN